jgi:DNA-binding response OmpR family regulator
MEQPTHVLLVDDEPFWRERLQQRLSQLGYRVLVAANGTEALQQFARYQVDLVILDLDLPDMDGIQICRELRKFSVVPIVLFSESATPATIVEALERGADDFVMKAVHGRELAVRLEAILRRSRQKDHRRLYRIGGVTLNPDTHEVTVGGKPVELRPKEYELLHYLMDHAEQPHSKEVLSEAIWGYELLNPNVVETAVGRLRKKIEADPANPKHLITIRGIGYQLV